MERLRVTEYIDLDLADESWYCHICGCRMGSARANYKEGCLLHNRDPREIHAPLIQGQFTFSPNPVWIRIIEFYCPGCGTQVDTEYLPPGHPITHDIQIDIDQLKERLQRSELAIAGNRLAMGR